MPGDRPLTDRQTGDSSNMAFYTERSNSCFSARFLRFVERCPVCQVRAATETIGLAGGLAPSEPVKGRSEKAKTPPSSATIR